MQANPASKEFYKYPLPWALCTMLCIYMNMDFLQDLSRVPFAILLELAWVAIVFQVIKWADAYEPEPNLAMLWTILAGASLSILVVDFAYELEGPNDYGVLFVGVVEEFAKALILVPIFRSNLIHSWIDGYVYGALAGLGFSVSEDYLYAAFEPDPTDVILSRGMESIFAHSLFTGLVGAALAFAIAQKHKIGIALAVAGVLSHVAWNTVIIEVIATDTVMIIFLTPAVFAYVAKKLRNEEFKEILALANGLEKSGLIDKHEFNLLTNLSYRNTFRKSHPTVAAKREFDASVNRIITGKL
jgi:RsiW-degrading membrane proteinase PrsW (M82 family)